MGNWVRFHAILSKARTIEPHTVWWKASTTHMEGMGEALSSL